MAQIALGVGAAARSPLFESGRISVGSFPLLDAAQVHIYQALLSLGCFILTERRERFFWINLTLICGCYPGVTIKFLNLTPGHRLHRDHRAVHPLYVLLPNSLREVLPYRSLKLSTRCFAVFLLIEFSLMLVSDRFPSDTGQSRRFEPAHGELPLFLQLLLKFAVLGRGHQKTLGDLVHVCQLQLHMGESSLLARGLDRGWVPGRSRVFSHHGSGQSLRVHRRLEREAIGHLHFVPDNNASSVQLVLVLLEAARLEIKDLLDRRKYLRQEASLGPGKHTFVGSLVASVEETVFFAIMSV